MSDDRIDATGAEITAAAPDMLTGKALAAWPAMAMLAVLAGVFIAFGSIAFLIAQAAPGDISGAGQLLSGLVFSVGLVLTMVAGAELFTGNTLFVLPLVMGRLGSGRLGLGRMVAAWGLVWVGNLVGSVIVAALFVAAGGGDGVDGLVGDAAVAIATAKVGKGAFALVASGVLANMLVCPAVWMAMTAKSIPSRIGAIVGPVTVFVAAGFEHSIANQSLLPIGWLLQTGHAIGLDGIARNLMFSTIGNVVGGAGVALAFGHAHRGG